MKMKVRPRYYYSILQVGCAYLNGLVYLHMDMVLCHYSTGENTSSILNNFIGRIWGRETSISLSYEPFIWTNVEDSRNNSVQPGVKVKSIRSYAIGKSILFFWGWEISGGGLIIGEIFKNALNFYLLFITYNSICWIFLVFLFHYLIFG